ncbi:protein phosphatase 2C [Nitzschia inconspicua]|uniref:Protein phosphatase 2C n=1 Tax=Nitzschia inconspicua TaxID=303405 RepID=A0A9K3L7X9_9STRA|nr:protein phosphatase 2C [Nitzschia inconspicua]
MFQMKNSRNGFTTAVIGVGATVCTVYAMKTLLMMYYDTNQRDDDDDNDDDNCQFNNINNIFGILKQYYYQSDNNQKKQVPSNSTTMLKTHPPPTKDDGDIITTATTPSTPIADAILVVPSSTTTVVVPDDTSQFQTPSPKKTMVVNQRIVSEAKARNECRDKVIEASEALAEAEFYPENKKNKAETAFRIAANKSMIQPNKLNKLRKLIQNEPWLLKARSFGLGLNCPDGYTLLMAAAFGGQVDAAKVILDAATIHKETFPEMESLHLDRNILGKAPIAIAAEAGHMEMVDFLTPLHMTPIPETTDFVQLVLSPPIDSLGRTPLGNAIMSPNPKARSNKKALESKLFSPDDMSIRGRYHPVQDRMTVLPTDLQLAYGIAEMPGRRIAMEDAVCTDVWDQHLLLEKEGTAVSQVIKVSFSLLGVCDGHGDSGQVSAFVAENVAPILRQMIESISNGNAIDMSSEEFWKKVWTATSIEVDARLKKKKLEGGSTAVFTLITKEYIITANTGDSRAVLIQTNGVKPLSFDHKPEDPIETARVTKAGMTVVHLNIPDQNGNDIMYHKIAKDSSLKNTMSVARAYGDFDYKCCCKAKRDVATENAEEEEVEEQTAILLPPEEQPITCVPDVTIHKRQPNTDCYLVIACDGIWDVMSNEDVGDFVKNQIRRMNEENVSQALLPEVGDALLQECLVKGSLDNMSTIIVSLKPEDEPLLVSSNGMSPKALEF